MTTVAPIQNENKSTALRDVAISAGVGLLGGATGMAAGYSMKPSAKQYAKAVISEGLNLADYFTGIVNISKECPKGEQKQFLKYFKALEKILKDPKSFLEGVEGNISGGDGFQLQNPTEKLSTRIANFFKGKRDKRTLVQVADDVADLLKQKVADISSPEFRNSLIEKYKSFDNDLKNQLKPLARGSNMLKWGLIGAAAASLLSTYLLCFAKDRNDNNQSEQV